jgi:hypothetical protein
MADWSERFEDSRHTLSDAERDRQRVVQALERVEQSERDAVDGLRAAICTLVTTLRTEGASAEQAAAEVRKLIEVPATPEGAGALAPAVREALVDLALHWCTEEYARSVK